MKPALQKRLKADVPVLNQYELGRYIVCDIIDDLMAAETHMRTLRKAAESALAALSAAKKEGE